MNGLENLNREGFHALQDVNFRSITIDQLKITFHGFRYDEGFAVYTAPHMHSFYELHYILEGMIRTKVNDVERLYTAGQYYLMAPTSIHSHGRQEEPSTHRVSFAIRFELQSRAREEFNPESDSVRVALERSQAINMEDYDNSIAGQMNYIIGMAKNGASRLELLTCAAGLIVRIGNRYAQVNGNSRQPPAMPKAAETILQRSIVYVESHISEMISPTDVAASIPISYSHLARLFSQYMGCSINDYIMRVKIDRATHLLMSTDTDVTGIAHAAGFSSLSYFSHMFKKYTGLSPRDYRKYWSERYFKGSYTIL